MGLQLSNEKAMIAALAKVQECQDFVLSKKKRSPQEEQRSYQGLGGYVSIRVCSLLVLVGGWGPFTFGVVLVLLLLYYASIDLVVLVVILLALDA